MPLPVPPARAPVGAVATVQARLARQRPRPLLVRLYAATLGDGGVAGAPARRRARRAVIRSLPAVVTVALAALLVLGVFEGVAQARLQRLGWARSGALLALAVALVAIVWRRAAHAARGVAASYREQLELGGLFVVGAYTVLQAARAGPGESPLQPVVYLVMAFLVAFLARGVGFGLVGFAAALEVAQWWGRGANLAELPAVLVHAGFVALFAALVHAALRAQVAASRRAEEAAVRCRLEEIAERAREFNRLAAGAEASVNAQRWTEASVVELETAVRGAVEIAEVALRTHTCAVFLLSGDDASLLLRECRSASDAVARSPIPAGEGALGGAVRRKAPVRLHGDVKAVNYYVDGTRPGALLAVPIVDRRGGFVRGVFVADRLEANPFGEDDERLLAALSAEIVRAVHSEKLLADMKRTRDEKARFFEAIEQLNRATKLPDVFATTLGVARDLARVDFAALTLVEEENGKRRHRIVRVAGADAAHDHLTGLTFSDEEGVVASAVKFGSSLGKDVDPSKAPVFDAGTRLRGIAALRIILLRAGEKVLGTLVVGSRGAGAFEVDDVVRQLDMIGMQAGDALLRARLFEETERLATTDGLTGLLNHRTFQTRLDEHLLAAGRYGKRLSFLLCDIDHFKSVNDTYGHPVGDQVLRGVARTLAKEARGTDVVARYGGEEFAIVMPETDTGGALVIAERIRERIRALVFETDQGPLRVTMSLGVATFPEDAAKKADLVERADGCLYHAKRHGRNQSVAAADLRNPRPAAARPPAARTG